MTLGQLPTVGCAIVAVASGCQPHWKQAPHDARFQRAQVPVYHEQPKRNARFSDWWDRAYVSTIRPLGRALSPARYLEVAVGGRPALDVNSFGEVADSPWFENRIGRHAMSDAELRRGANRSPGPAPGTLLVISGKTAGATPGVVLRDSIGVEWFVKFDPPAFVEMTTSAETIASRLLHAAGYHVPEMHLVDLDVRRLHLARNATNRNRYNQRKKMTQTDLRALLALLNTDATHRIRALFSRSIPGTHLGPFSYTGVRADDPNDRIPHERRRSLRGLWVLSAWLNNTDTRMANTLDAFITSDISPKLGHVRHYLIDFGDSLGAGGEEEKHAGEGYVYRIDWRETAKSALSLGLYYPYWFQLRRSPYRSVGIFEADVFEPSRWRPVFQNAAFWAATPKDTFWASTILARFTPRLIQAAVAEGRYTEYGAADYVASVLQKRRRKLLRYAWRKMLPLCNPTIRYGYRVLLEDLAVTSGVAPKRRYHFRLRWNRTSRADRIIASGSTSRPEFALRPAVRQLVLQSGKKFADDPFLTLTVWQVRHGKRGPAIELHLRAAGDHVLPVALEREVR